MVQVLGRFLPMTPVAPIGGAGGAAAPKIHKKIFFIGLIDSMFNICTWIDQALVHWF